MIHFGGIFRPFFALPSAERTKKIISNEKDLYIPVPAGRSEAIGGGFIVSSPSPKGHFAALLDLGDMIF